MLDYTALQRSLIIIVKENPIILVLETEPSFLSLDGFTGNLLNECKFCTVFWYPSFYIHFEFFKRRRSLEERQSRVSIVMVKELIICNQYSKIGIKKRPCLNTIFCYSKFACHEVWAFQIIFYYKNLTYIFDKYLQQMTKKLKFTVNIWIDVCKLFLILLYEYDLLFPLVCGYGTSGQQ